MAYLNGSVNVVNALLFGGASQETREAIEREHHAFVQNVDPRWGGTLLERTQQLFNSYNGAHVVQMVQNALNNVVSIAKPDVVLQLNRMTDFQTALPTMQAYVMANPMARKLYHAHQCDGYSDTYVDMAPGVIGFGHAHYEQVMNGVVVVPTDPQGDVHYTNYARAWDTESSQMLNLAQRASVLNTWSELERMFKEAEADPTSPWGASL